MIATAVVAQSRVVLAFIQNSWQDFALLFAGVLVLMLATLIVYRRRRAERKHAYRVPLIEKKPSPEQPLRPAVPPYAILEPRGIQRNGHATVAATPTPSLNGAATAGPPVLTPLPPRPAPPAALHIENIEPSEAERSAPDHSSVAPAEEEGEEVRAGLVRFHRPPEGTLQLLPGRLDIIAGKERVDVIRFVKVPGKETIITFGRSQGEPHMHIELQSPTVSRRHAAMRYHNGMWHIKNLSTTNPVVVRGKQLMVTDLPVRLMDGDQIEMGEVTFRFHERHVVDRLPVNLVDRLLDELPRRLAEGNVDIQGGQRRWASGAPGRPAPATSGRAHTLTGRETEIAQLVADGKSNRAIAEALDISPRTVSTHLTNIFRKLDVASRSELADYVSNKNKAAEQRAAAALAPAPYDLGLAVASPRKNLE